MCTLLIHKQKVATQCYVDLPHVDISPVIIILSNIILIFDIKENE